jgi:hypothetical protein
MKVAALGWPALVDGATAAARSAMNAPLARGLVERVNPQKLAAKRAFAAASPRHQLHHIARIV